MKKILRTTALLQVLALIFILGLGENAKALEGPAECLKLCDAVPGVTSIVDLGECWTVIAQELDEMEGNTTYCTSGNGTCNAKWCDWEEPGCGGSGLNPGCAADN